MSSVYNADGSIPAATNPWVRKAISGSTFATPTVLTVMGHGFGNGDTISVEGHDVNTNANGVHQITVLTANTFSLNGVVGNGVGGATGYCVDYSVNPLITLPGDGDLANASSVNPAFEGIFNAVPYLYRRVGKYALIDHYEYQLEPSPFPEGVINTFTIAMGTSDPGDWFAVAGLQNLLTTSPAPALLAGDYLFAELDIGRIQVGASGEDPRKIRGWGMTYGTNGGSSAINSTYTAYSSDDNGSASTLEYPVRMVLPINVTANADTFNFGLAYWFKSTSGTSAPIVAQILGKIALTVKHYRSNA